jgi:hypothetical protein
LDEAATIGGSGRYPVDEYVGLRLLSDLAFAQGRVAEGLALIRRAVEQAANAEDDWWVIDAEISLAVRALDLGLLGDARPAAREALRLSTKIADRQNTIWTLSVLARESAAQGLGHRAGRIWGGLEAEVERGGPVGQWELEQDAIREQVVALAGDAFHDGAAEGWSLSLEDVVAEALNPT